MHPVSRRCSTSSRLKKDLASPFPVALHSSHFQFSTTDDESSSRSCQSPSTQSLMSRPSFLAKMETACQHRTATSPSPRKTSRLLGCPMPGGARPQPQLHRRRLDKVLNAISDVWMSEDAASLAVVGHVIGDADGDA